MSKPAEIQINRRGCSDAMTADDVKALNLLLRIARSREMAERINYRHADRAEYRGGWAGDDSKTTVFVPQKGNRS